MNIWSWRGGGGMCIKGTPISIMTSTSVVELPTRDRGGERSEEWREDLRDIPAFPSVAPLPPIKSVEDGQMSPVQILSLIQPRRPSKSFPLPFLHWPSLLFSFLPIDNVDNSHWFQKVLCRDQDDTFMQKYNVHVEVGFAISMLVTIHTWVTTIHKSNWPYLTISTKPLNNNKKEKATAASSLNLSIEARAFELNL